jgi:multidrug efflux pump subunit AcrA (membrane-fusion protein)
LKWSGKTAWILSAILGAAFFIGTGSTAARASKIEKIPVKVQPVVRRDLSAAISVLGTVKYLTKADVSSEIDGILRSVEVEEGDRVQQGQVIATIDTSILEAQLKEMQTDLELAELNLPKWRNELKKLELNLAKNRIALENYRQLFESQQKLYKTGGISRARLNRAEIDYQSALLEYNTVKEDLQTLKTRSKQGRSEVEARVAKAQADIGEVRTRLAKCIIRAPISGVVAAKRKWTGEKTGDGGHVIATILQTDAVYAEVEISEKKIGKITIGQQAGVRADAYPEEAFEGKVHSISPTVEPTSRTVRVKVKVPNQKQLLKPGMFVRVNIFLDRRGEVLLVPSTALFKARNNRIMAFVVVDEIAFLRTVQTGGREENSVIIKAGLKEGELVVVEGQRELKNLSAVEIIGSGTK